MPKEIRYATIPETFDETKHYIEQLPAVDMGEYMWVDVVVKDLDLTGAPVEPHAPIENEPYIPKPTTEEVLNEVIAVLIDKGVLY
jgi:hypothetical protein